MSWQDDKRWSDRFVEEMAGIVGKHLIGPAPEEEDRERNTDLIVLRMDRVRIACRIRRFEQLGLYSYSDEFTIRTSRPSGVKTERTKIIEGWGDYFFYGFSDAASVKLARWTLADLRVFRRGYALMLARCDAGVLPGRRKPNRDGSSEFDIFRWDEFPAGFVVASDRPSGPIPASSPVVRAERAPDGNNAPDLFGWAGT